MTATLSKRRGADPAGPAGRAAKPGGAQRPAVRPASAARTAPDPPGQVRKREGLGPPGRAGPPLSAPPAMDELRAVLRLSKQVPEARVIREAATRLRELL